MLNYYLNRTDKEQQASRVYKILVSQWWICLGTLQNDYQCMRRLSENFVTWCRADVLVNLKGLAFLQGTEWFPYQGLLNETLQQVIC